MPDPTPLDLVTGAPAAGQVAQDPFWSVVVRRHGDVDVVVLPPESPPDVPIPDDEPVVDPAPARARFRERLAGLWSALGLEGEPAVLDDVWFAGPVAGTLRWQGTARFDAVDPVEASSVLRGAVELLSESAGWRVLAPADGVPRVLAGRPARLGREEVQVLAPDSSRLVLRIRSEVVVVGEAAAAEVLRTREDGA